MCGDGGGGPAGGDPNAAVDAFSGQPIQGFDSMSSMGQAAQAAHTGGISSQGFAAGDPYGGMSDFDSAIPVNKAFNQTVISNPWGLFTDTVDLFSNPNLLNFANKALNVSKNFSEEPMSFEKGAQTATDAANAALGRGGSYGGGMDSLAGGPGDAEGGGNALPGAAPGVGGSSGPALASGLEFSAGKYYNRFSGEQLTPEQFMSKLNASKFMR